MENIELQPLQLYWGLIWIVLGGLVTPLVFDRRNRNPWWGAFFGMVMGFISGQIFGYIILLLLADINSALAAWTSALGGLVLLIPVWYFTSPIERAKLQQPGFVPSTIAPLTFYLIALSIFPIVWSVTLSFYDYSPRREGGAVLGFGGNNPYVGLQHYEDMIAGESRDARMFTNAMKNTLIFTVLVLPLNLLITLPLSMLIESTHDWVKPIFRAIYFLPVVTSSVGVAVMWGYIFNGRYGLVNDGLRLMGLEPIAWISDPSANILGLSAAMVAVVIAYLWQDFGYNLVIFIAAQQNIPEELKDAARVDGANILQIVWHIILPLLRPTIMVTAILTMISSFQVFDIIQVMTEGGPGRIGQTRVMVLDIYENAFRFEQMGWAASNSIVLVAIVMLITLFQLRVFRSDWEY